MLLTRVAVPHSLAPLVLSARAGARGTEVDAAVIVEHPLMNGARRPSPELGACGSTLVVGAALPEHGALTIRQLSPVI